MKLLVMGATGGTGRQVVRQARERGLDVTVLIRDPQQAAELPGVTPVVGDARDPKAVAEAVVGVDGVISCLGARVGTAPGNVRSAGTRTLVAAMTSAGVPRLVAVSTVGVGDSVARQSRVARMLWPRIVGRERLAEADAAEAAIRQSVLSWTVVRPPRLVDGAGGARVRVGTQIATGMNSQISRTDLARVLLDLVTSRDHQGEAVTVVAGSR